MGKKQNQVAPVPASTTAPTAAPQAPVAIDPPVVEIKPAPPPPPAPSKKAAEPLDEYIAKHEQAAQDDGLVVTAISHPDAKDRHHDGVYSGFPVTGGELSATYSDGTKH